jgi:hypothetical protein
VGVRWWRGGVAVDVAAAVWWRIAGDKHEAVHDYIAQELSLGAHRPPVLHIYKLPMRKPTSAAKHLLLGGRVRWRKGWHKGMSWCSVALHCQMICVWSEESPLVCFF